MSKSDLAEVMARYHVSIDAFLKGDPEPQKKLLSRRDDITLANPLGPPARGWDEVARALDGAASAVRDGDFEFEILSEYAGTDLSYILEIERWRAKLGGADEVSSGSLRATTIFRREDDGWKFLHRHADPITSPRSIESIVAPERGTREAPGPRRSLKAFAPDLTEVVDRYHSSQLAFVNGDPDPTKEMWSRHGDVTLANPLGPPGRGWDAVESILDRAASAIGHGVYDFETITGYAGTDLAYILELEHVRAKVGGADAVVSFSLRVTTVFRREDGEWKVVHRHADPITSARSIESVVEREAAPEERRT
ncbi:MAG: nuclear transport factor 2 family protein [Candidatus Limnocylindria bacterium]